MNLPDSRTSYLVLWIFLFMVVFIEKSFLHFFEDLVVDYLDPPVEEESFKRQLHVDEMSYLRFSEDLVVDYVDPQEEEEPFEAYPVYFMKTHKTGSSTLQNIIYRYALTYNLTVGLPKDDGVYLCKHRPIKANCTDEPDGNYQVIANHHVWSPFIDKALPTAKKITILRDPITQIISAWFYFSHIDMGFKDESIKLKAFEQFIAKENLGKRVGNARFLENGRNPCAFDLGLMDIYEKLGSERAVAEWLVGYYDLILITEHFDESLILLKELLRLKYEDIVYFSAKKNQKKDFHVDDLSEQMTKKILDRQKVDKAIHEAANRTLFKKIEKFGVEKMEKELKIFNEFKERADKSDELLNLEGKEFCRYMQNLKKSSSQKLRS